MGKYGTWGNVLLEFHKLIKITPDVHTQFVWLNETPQMYNIFRSRVTEMWHFVETAGIDNSPSGY